MINERNRRRKMKTPNRRTSPFLTQIEHIARVRIENLRYFSVVALLVKPKRR